MSVISTGNNPKFLFPGLNAVWGKNYTDYPLEYTDLFDVQSSDKAYEEDVEEPGFGLVPVKPQGEATTYMSTAQGTVTRYNQVAFGSGFVITHEEWMDNLYEKKGLSRAQRLSRSFRLTKETVCANVYNRAHTAGYTGGDGSILCVTSHACFNGNQSNCLATAADMSEASIEDLVVQLMGATDSQGLIIKAQPKSLIIPKELVFEATRILKSTGQNDTTNNAVNALKMLGIIPEVKVNHFLTDTDAFFIRTDVPDGMKLFQREEPIFAEDGDFETGNQKYKGYERYIVGWSDWRGVYSNGGGA